MKKTLLAVALAASMVSGCSMLGGESEPETLAQINARATELSQEGYHQSSVKTLEQVRLPINSLYSESVPILNDYVKHLDSYKEGSQVQTTLSFEKSEEDRLAKLDEMKNDPKQKAAYDDYIAMINDDAMKSIYKHIGKVAIEIAEEALVFSKLDQKALLTDVDWAKLPDEKGNLQFTMDELSILNSSFVSLNDEYNNNKAAGLIK